MTKEDSTAFFKSLQMSYPQQMQMTQDFSVVFVKYLQGLDINKAKRAGAICVQKEKFFPTIASFNEVYLSIVNQTESFQNVKCDICCSSGVLYYTKRVYNTDYDYFAYCDCENGEQFKIGGKIWHTKHHSEVCPPEWTKAETKDIFKGLGSVERFETIRKMIRNFGRVATNG
jgi:hypothetical protein